MSEHNMPENTRNARPADAEQRGLLADLGPYAAPIITAAAGFAVKQLGGDKAPPAGEPPKNDPPPKTE